MSARLLAGKLIQHVKKRRADNHAAMDKGPKDEEYRKLVGRNAELGEMLRTITDELRKIEGEDEDDD